MKQEAISHPRVFDEQAWAEGYYDRNKGNIRRVGKRFADLLKKSGFTGGRILDVGCGFAAMDIEIARAFPDVEITGIDLGEPLLAIGRTLVSEAGLKNKITLMKDDAHQLSFGDDSFNLVINAFLLHIVEYPVIMLNEIERVARPEARIMITDLRRGFLANFIPKFRKAHTLEEALEVIGRSCLREGKPAAGPFWWDYMSGLSY